MFKSFFMKLYFELKKINKKKQKINHTPEISAVLKELI